MPSPERDPVDALVEEAKRLQPDKTRFTAEQVLALAARLEAAERKLRDTTAGLDELLHVAEMMRRGDPGLDPEEWYAARDFARKLLRAEDAPDA